MGVSTGCAIIVGLYPEDFPDDIDEICNEEGWVDHLCEHLGLDKVSPHYDARNADCIFGVIIAGACYGATRAIPENLADEIQEAKAHFKELIGVEGVLYVSPDVS